MSLEFVAVFTVLVCVAFGAVLFQRGLFVLLLLLPASEMLGFVDPMTLAVKGAFDIHALLALLILAATLFSVNRWQELPSTLFLKPMLVFVSLWLYGVLYPVAQDYSTLFYALKASKEFLTIFAYFAVFLFVRTENELQWGWKILIGFGLYYSLLELLAQVFGSTLMSHMVYAFRKEDLAFLWKIYPPFWTVILIALLHSYYEYALGGRRVFVRIGFGSIGLLLTFFRSYLLAAVGTIPLLLLLSRQGMRRAVGQGIALAMIIVVAIGGVWVATANQGGNMESLTDHFVSSGIMEFDTQTGGAIVGREKFSKGRRQLLEQSPYLGFGFIDKDSLFGRQVHRHVIGDTLGFIDKGDVDTALKFGYAGRLLLYGTVLYMAYILVRLARKCPTPMLCVRALTLASLLIIFLIVQPVHAALTYSFSLLPLGIGLGLLEREWSLHSQRAQSP